MKRKYYWMKLTLQSEKGTSSLSLAGMVLEKHTVQYDRWYASTQSRIDLFKDQLITKIQKKRARFLSRVFQDPKMGTAPRMTVAENLLLAQKRSKRKFRLRNLKIKRRFSDYVKKSVMA